ncbi:MAG: hypothetical protein GY906_13565 [bacterium]|nr:hypothetical protein [bacterium]
MRYLSFHPTVTSNPCAWIFELDIATPNDCGDARGAAVPWLTQEPDSDGDGARDPQDHYPYDPDRTIDYDADRDGVPDSLDTCPTTANPGQSDVDGDFVGTRCDNCPDDWNPDQEDTDGDGIGDVCDICDTPHPFGDVTDDNLPTCPPGPGTPVSGCGAQVALPDIVYVLNAFAQGASWTECYPNADLCHPDVDPCGGDGNVGLPDIVCVLEAFAGDLACVSDCPCR